MLTRIVNGTQASNPIEGFIPGNGFTFFQADDGIHGSELWRTDGTPAGTSLIKDILPGPLGSAPHNLTAFDGKLIFTANDGHARRASLDQRRDRRRHGPAQGHQPRPGLYARQASTDFTEVNGVMYFSANDGTHGTELWRTDGTAAGTFLLKDIDPSKLTWAINTIRLRLLPQRFHGLQRKALLPGQRTSCTGPSSG